MKFIPFQNMYNQKVQQNNYTEANRTEQAYLTSCKRTYKPLMLY